MPIDASRCVLWRSGYSVAYRATHQGPSRTSAVGPDSRPPPADSALQANDSVVIDHGLRRRDIQGGNCHSTCLDSSLSIAQQSSEYVMARARLRDLGITVGQLPTGPLNAITDVA